MSNESEDRLLALLNDLGGVLKVGGGAVPLPSATGEMVEHLFVNLTLGSFVQSDDIAGLASQLRDIAFGTFLRLRRDREATRYKTICVSLFIPMTPTEGTRIYRARLNASDLPRLERGNFEELVTGEESGKRELNDFFHISR
jgi:hypothetical protein